MIPVASAKVLKGSYVEQQNRSGQPLIDYERGGLALGQATSNLTEALWTAQYIDGSVVVFRDNVPPVIILTEPGITQIALAFDQSMQAHIAYMVGNVCKFYYYSTLENGMRTMEIPGATNPRLCLDEKRSPFSGRADILLSYKKGTDLVVRVQRERYGVEYVLASNLPGDLLSVGLNSVNRLQWNLRRS
ncbi:tail fiber protein [Xanthomonas phage RiverRider]|uniref:Tail fiber protein n=1 Tax=Xanthomonas phage RiverRider TaxID=2108116 RepID=A0A2P1JUY9_9CAUD|nr:tail fiber protein [Xanthomonas phage RiverRider]AVO23165.1 tail fiber protein [Xanthomonas phage RiverRider]